MEITEKIENAEKMMTDISEKLKLAIDDLAKLHDEHSRAGKRTELKLMQLKRIHNLVDRMGATFCASEQYDHYNIEQHQGIEFIKEPVTKKAINMRPNGRIALKITAWKHLPEWTTDRKEMDTEIWSVNT